LRSKTAVSGSSQRSAGRVPHRWTGDRERAYITRNHSSPRSAEFWAEPQNSALSA